jgi:membrane fusion protein, multidrug efflux system
MMYRKHGAALRRVLLLGASALLAGCGGDAGEDSRSMEEIHREEGVPVTVREVEPLEFRTHLLFTATLSGASESTATALISDEIESVRARVGDYVEKDQIIVTFPADNTALNYDQARVSFESARTAFERISALYATGGVAQQAFDDARTQFDLAKAQWENVRNIREVSAPISGYLTRLNVVESENVAPGDPLFTVSNYETLRATVWIPDRDIDQVRSGLNASATWRGREVQGMVTQVDLSMDPDRRAFGAKLEFQNRDREISSGSVGDIRIYTYENDEAVVLRRQETVEEDGGVFVFLAENGAALLRPVTVGRRQGFHYEITAGLLPGDSVVTEGVSQLADGDKISVVGSAGPLVMGEE